MKKIYLFTSLLIAFFVISTKVQAASEYAGVWYVYYNTSEFNLGPSASSSKFTWSETNAAQTLTFEAYKTMATAVGDLAIYECVNGSWKEKKTIDVGDLKKDTYKTFTVQLSQNATGIYFKCLSSSYKRYIRNVKVTMAQYTNDPSAASLAWGEGKVDDANVAKSFTIAWCNVPAFTYAVTGSGAEQIQVAISNNASAGKVGTATVNVTYNRNVASTLDATLTISNTYGSYSKSIKLTGSTTKYDQSLSWNNEGAIELNMLLGTTQIIGAVSDMEQVVSYSSSNSAVLSVNAAGLLTANAVGEATITAYQEGDYKFNAATSITKTFLVKSKDTPIFTPNEFEAETDKPAKVDDSFTLTVAHVSDGLDGDFSATYNAEEFVVTREGNVITIQVIKAGKNTITFVQTENSAIAAASQSYTFEVSKYDPEFSWEGIATARGTNSHFSTSFSSTNEDVALSLTNLTPSIAEYNEGFIYIYGNAGTAKFTLSQEENYKFNAKSQDYQFSVSAPSRYLEMNINSEAAYNQYKTGEHSMRWNSRVEFKEKNVSSKSEVRYVEFSFSGVPDRLQFSTGSAATTTTPKWEWKQYVDGAWVSIGSKEAKETTVDVQLNPAATAIRIEYSKPTNEGYLKSLKVTQLKKFEVSAKTLDFGENVIGTSVDSKTVTLSYATIGYKVSALTNDSQFVVTPAFVSDLGGDQYGEYKFTVTYLTDKYHTAENAKLTLSDELGHSCEIALLGSTVKAPAAEQTISWQPAELEVLASGTIDLNATASSGLPVTYAITQGEDICAIVDGVAIISGIGQVTIVASQAGNDDYAEAAPVAQTFTIDQGYQTISWNSAFTDDFIYLSIGDSLTDIASSNHGLELSFYIENESTSIMIVGNTLYAVAEDIVSVTPYQLGNAVFAYAEGDTKTFIISGSHTTPVAQTGAKEEVVRKVLVNGQLRILSGEHTYDAQGQLIR